MFCSLKYRKEGCCVLRFYAKQCIPGVFACGWCAYVCDLCFMTAYVFKQSLSKHNRSNIGTEGGPPPFLPFGQVRTFFWSVTLSGKNVLHCTHAVCCCVVYSDVVELHGNRKDKEFNNFATPKIEAIKNYVQRTNYS